MARKRIEIPAELVNYIEGLAYRVAARKDLLAFMVGHGYGDSDAFRNYNREYEELFAQYEIAKAELAKTYVVPEYPNSAWNLDFTEGALYIEVRE